MNCCNAFGECKRGPGCPAGSRLAPPPPLPDVEADPGRAGAEVFFAGMWFFVTVGAVIGAGLPVLFTGRQG